MQSPPAKPLFVTFEGIDGSGKSTHLSRAVEWLESRGHRFRFTKEPGGTDLGNAIRAVFLDPQWGKMDGRVEAMLVFGSRRQNLVELIEPALAAGEHVICDRFTDSSLAYQGVRDETPPEWIAELDELVTGGKRPDHTLLFDLDPATAVTRGRSTKRQEAGDVDRLDVLEMEFYQRVRATYHGLVEREPDRFHVIDSGGEKEATWQQVEAILEKLFGGPA